MQRIKNENILFLDIETASSEYRYENLSERMQELWQKKTLWLSEKENKTPQELYEKAGIWAEFGKIVCISVGYIQNNNDKQILRIKSFYGTNEHDLLQNFAELLNHHFYKEQHYLCAHNGKEFDFPYIARRMLINGIQLPILLQMSGKKPWEIKHIDTLELWKFGDYKHYTSLDLLTSLFDIPSPKDDIDGSMVNKIFWEDNNTEKIATYCEKDVIALTRLYLKLQGEFNIDDLEIESTLPSVSN